MNAGSHYQLIKSKFELDTFIKDGEKVFALIYATWCPFCVSFLPVFKRYARDREDFLLVEDDQWIIAEKYAVKVVPTVLCLEHGAIIKRLDGVLGMGLNGKQLADFIEVCNL